MYKIFIKIFSSARVCGEGKCLNVCVMDLKSHVLFLAVHGGWSASGDSLQTRNILIVAVAGDCPRSLL